MTTKLKWTGPLQNDPVAWAFGLQTKPPGMEDESVLRYMRNGDIANYTLWNGTENVELRYMHDYSVPDWLQRIADIAVVGGHMRSTLGTTGNIGLGSIDFFWCAVDADRNVLRFLDL